MIFIGAAGFVPIAFVDRDHFSGMAGDAAIGEEIRRVGEDEVDGRFGDLGEEFEAIAVVEADVVFCIVEGGRRERIGGEFGHGAKVFSRQSSVVSKRKKKRIPRCARDDGKFERKKKKEGGLKPCPYTIQIQGNSNSAQFKIETRLESEGEGRRDGGVTNGAERPRTRELGGWKPALRRGGSGAVGVCLLEKAPSLASAKIQKYQEEP